MCFFINSSLKGYSIEQIPLHFNLKKYKRWFPSFIFYNLSIQNHHSYLFVEKIVSTIFFNLFFLVVQEQRKLKFSSKTKRGQYVGENIKILRRLEPIKPQCSAGPAVKKTF